MSPRYSRYKSKFFIDPDHEKQATAFVNSLGSSYILEGALDLSNGDLRIWYKNTKTNKFSCKIIPIVVNFDYAPALIPETEEIEDIEEEKDSATDEQFLIEKK